MIGSLRARVTIERLADPQPQDSFGAPIETWEPHAERWAALLPLTGREYFQAQQTQTAVDHRIRFRYDDATREITPKMRIRHGGRVFDVRSVLNPETRNQWIDVMAQVRA